MVAGSTASGKTMLCNAIIQEIAQQFSDERLLILEDTPELQCIWHDFLHLRTTDTMCRLVKYSLRCTPDRIIIGEMRDGATNDPPGCLDQRASGRARDGAW